MAPVRAYRGRRGFFRELVDDDPIVQAAAGRLLLGGDPAVVLDEEDPLRLAVQEAVLHRAVDLDHQRDKRLAREISNEMAVMLKRMFG